MDVASKEQDKKVAHLQSDRASKLELLDGLDKKLTHDRLAFDKTTHD